MLLMCYRPQPATHSLHPLAVPRRLFSYVSVCAIAAACTAQASAQDAYQDETAHPHLEEIVVSSHLLEQSRKHLGQNISVLAGEALERSRASTLGATLDALPGLAQASFGPAVSRPVIRGLSGDRVRVLINGIGTIDAASSSPDHALAVNTEQAEKIEVLKGPATLLFGNNAVGGAINIFDGRIPSKQPDEIEGYAASSYNTNGNAYNTSAGITAPLGKSFALHVDGAYYDRSDLEIPGFAVSRPVRPLLEEGTESARGTVSNSAQERYALTAGLSYIADDAFVGVAVNYFDNTYGLPERPEGIFSAAGAPDLGAGGEEEEEEGDVAIAQDQLRLDLISDINRDILIFKKLKLRFSYGDYSHVEQIGDEDGTLFSNEGFEGRLELVQKDYGALSGALGVQYRERDFSAIGDEAFIPPTTTKQLGLFALETIQTGPWTLEAGARAEFQDITLTSGLLEDQSLLAAQARDGTIPLNVSETGLSFSGAVSYALSEAWSFNIYGYRTERAPSVEELFSNGPHEATQTFDLGTPDLGLETATGFELRAAYLSKAVSASLAYFYTSYDDFIFQNFTGSVEDGLPVSQYQATNARYQGFEFEADYTAYNSEGRTLKLGLVADYVRAVDRNTSLPLPRIPALTATFSTLYQTDDYDFNASLTWADSQRRTADFEFDTPSYADLSVSFTYHLAGADGPLHLILKADNLLDETIRYATSPLKDFVPAQGRSLEIGFKLDI